MTSTPGIRPAAARLRHLAIAALALTAATSCGGARGSRCEPTQGSPAALPTPPDEARTTSMATAAISETMQPWSDGTSETAPNRFVEKNGIRFAYRAFGRKPGVPLLLLASFRGTMDSWDPLLTDALAQARPVILFDHAGVGLSSGDAPTTVADTAKDAETFVDALRELHFTDSDWVSGRVDLLGFSLGGVVAQQLALNRPHIVDRVVIAGTAPRGGIAHASAVGTLEGGLVVCGRTRFNSPRSGRRESSALAPRRFRGRRALARAVAEPVGQQTDHPPAVLRSDAGRRRA